MIIVVAFQEYLALTKSEACHPDVWVNLACCYFFLGMYKEGDEVAEKGRCQAHLHVRARKKTLNSSLSFVQAAITFCLPRATSCSS